MAGDNRDVSRKTKIIDVIKWSYEFCSTAGITQAKATDCKISKAAWIIIFLVGTGITYWSMIKCLQGYLSHGHVTSMDIKSEARVDFPSVTICNQNRVHCLNLYNLIRNCTEVENLCIFILSKHRKFNL